MNVFTTKNVKCFLEKHTVNYEQVMVELMSYSNENLLKNTTLYTEGIHNAEFRSQWKTFMYVFNLSG